MKYKKISYFLCICFLPLLSMAQQSVVSSGNTITNSTGSVSYTIGQPNYISIYSTEGVVNQGNQQAFEIYALDLDNIRDQNVTITVFPNPTNSFINIKMDELISGDIEAKIFDIQGKLIDEHKFNTVDPQINFLNFPSGIYILNIYNEKALLQSFKIIKN